MLFKLDSYKFKMLVIILKVTTKKITKKTYQKGNQNGTLQKINWIQKPFNGGSENKNYIRHTETDIYLFLFSEIITIQKQIQKIAEINPSLSLTTLNVYILNSPKRQR